MSVQFRVLEVSNLTNFVLVLQLLSHPFIRKYETEEVDLAGFVHSVFDPTERLKDLADVSSSLVVVPIVIGK